MGYGWHLAPEGSDDTHQPNWGKNGMWTGILAPGLSKRCIWDALKKRHVYSTRDRNCRLFFRVNGAEMGDIVEEPMESVEIEVVVKDGDAEDNIAKLELFENGVVVDTKECTAACCNWEITRLAEPGQHYYFVRITQADGNMLWSAPVWVDVGGE